MHACAVQYPEVVPSVVQQLMNYISDEESGANDVILFVRHIVEE